jgi:hypothetical protein
VKAYESQAFDTGPLAGSDICKSIAVLAFIRPSSRITTGTPAVNWCANDRVNIGVVGSGSRGKELIRQLLRTPGTEVVAVCDVYERRFCRGERTGRHKGCCVYGLWRIFGAQGSRRDLYRHAASIPCTIHHCRHEKRPVRCMEKRLLALLLKTPEMSWMLSTKPARSSR